MFMSSYSFVFLFFLTVFSMFTLNLNSLFFTWVLMELNLLLVTPLLLMKSNSSKEQSSLVLKYFLIQVIGSVFLIISFIYTNSSMLSLSKINLIFLLALMLKAGIPPLHFWFPPLMYLSNYTQAFILMCVQKIIPLFLMSMMFNDLYFMLISVSALVGGVMGFNQNSIMKVLAYSSMVHSGWMISGLAANPICSYFYFSVYVVTSLVILSALSKYTIKFVSEMIKNNSSLTLKMMFMLSIFTLSGTPPFIGFFAKLYILQNLMSMKFFMTSVALILGSTLSFFFYMRIITSTFLLSALASKEKILEQKANSLIFLVTLNLMGLVMMSIVA